MKAKLTKTYVNGLVSTGKRVAIFDTETPGLAMRVSEKGAKSFYFTYRPERGRGSEKRWHRLGGFPAMTCEQARVAAKMLAGEVALGNDPTERQRESKREPFFLDVFQVFMEEHVQAKKKDSTIRLYNSLSNLYIKPVLGKTKIGSVTAKQVAKLHYDMRSKPYMANRCLAVLSKFFAWCEQHGYRDGGTNPAARIEKFKEHKRTRFMGVDDLAKIGSALVYQESTGRIDPFAATAIRLLLFTGARLNEVLSLRWEDIDVEAGFAHIADSKTGAKVLHLGTPAIEILKNLPRLNKWVFPSRRGNSHIVNLRKPWVAVCAQAGLAGWRLHDLRHAFASAAANAGHSLPLIGGLLGHSQPATTARYAHVAQNPVHEVAESTAATLKNGLESGPLVKLRHNSRTP